MSFNQHEHVWKRPFYCLIAGLQEMTVHIQLRVAGSQFYFFIKPKSVCDKLKHHLWEYYFLKRSCSVKKQTLTCLPLTDFYNPSLHHMSWNNLLKKRFFLYFSTEIAGKILVTAECSITCNAEPPPGTETPVKGTVKMFQLVCWHFYLQWAINPIFKKLSVVDVPGKLSCHGKIGDADCLS